MMCLHYTYDDLENTWNARRDGWNKKKYGKKPMTFNVIRWEVIK